MTEKKSSTSRYMSVNAMASLLGKERSTITRWIEQEKAPVVSRPEEGSTAAYEIDPPAFIEWMVGREAERRVQKLLKDRAKESVPGDGVDPQEWSEGTSKRFRAVYIALREKLRYEQEASKLVEAELIQGAVAAEYAATRTVLAGMPARLRRAGVARAAIDIVMVCVNEALGKLKADQVSYAQEGSDDPCSTPPLQD